MSKILPSQINMSIHEKFKEMDNKVNSEVNINLDNVTSKIGDKFTWAFVGGLFAFPTLAYVGTIDPMMGSLAAIGSALAGGASVMVSQIVGSIKLDRNEAEQEFLKREVLKQQFHINEEPKLHEFSKLANEDFAEKFPTALYSKSVQESFENYKEQQKLSTKIKNVVDNIREKFSSAEEKPNLKFK